MPDDLHSDELHTAEPTAQREEPPADAAASDSPAPAQEPAAKKTTVRKTAARKTTARKAPAKKTPAAADAPAAGDAPVVDAAPVDEAGPAPAAGEAETAETPAKKTAAKKTAAKKTAAKKAPAKKAAARKTAAKKPAADEAEGTPEAAASEPAAEVATNEPAAPMVLFQAPEPTKAPARRTRKTAAAKAAEAAEAAEATGSAEAPGEAAAPEDAGEGTGAPAAKKAARKTTSRTRSGAPKPDAAQVDAAAADAEQPATVQADAGQAEAGQADAKQVERADAEGDAAEADAEKGERAEAGETEESEGGGRRRRRRGGRRRRKSSDGGEGAEAGDNAPTEDAAAADSSDSSDSTGDGETGADETPSEGSSRRRRRRRRTGDDGGESGDDPQNTVTRVRSKRSAEDEITAVSGSTRLEAKKQRRREGREAGRRRAPIVSEAEFLARRESVERVMVIRQRDELTQIGVLEDKVLVEHYVARESQTSLIGNVYLGRVQNVLPSMEAAFIDIGKGRNAVLYAGEVNWSALGHREGQPRKIESVLSSGQSVLVQVTKDPIGHKGARLTSQISLAGRFLVYVPDGTTSGISRKLPDTERNRLKALLKEIVPDTAGVIVRTAAEGASEEELTRDVERLKARWEDIEKKAKGSAPQLLYGEPDLTLKVVRDLFTEDFAKLVIQGDDAWDTVQGYVSHVAPDLQERLERFEPGENGKDVFATYRIEEQIAKGLDRKVWLPSGGSLIIDRTEAMTVVDVNTGKFTGSGGNLEETVTKNNLEAAEEIVRQLRLRDIGGIIVVDFIDMVLESNRDLVLRRLVECLGRDRTRHQVAEVTSLGLVQMTRKRIGTGLLEAFSENCEHCQGRGVVIKETPVDPKRSDDDSRRGGRRSRGGRSRGQDGDTHDSGNGQVAKAPSPKDLAAAAKPEGGDKVPADGSEAPARDAAADGQAHEPERTQGQSKQESREDGRRQDRRGGRGEQQPAPAVEEPAAPVGTGDTGAAARPAPAAPVEPTAPAAPVEPAPPAEPAAPKVVTRTRRRAASRPAGQPDQLTAPQPVVVESAPAPVAAPAASEAPAVEKPKVVTRTRGRSASRPAGPPAAEPVSAAGGGEPGSGDVPSMAAASTPPGAVGSVGAPPEHGVVEPGTAAAEPGHDVPAGDEEHHVEHVPIKKKGSRKR